MNPHNTNLKQQLREEQATDQFHRAGNQAQAQEFATVEDLLRYDSEKNPVPPEVADRLGRSLEAEPKPHKPWYRKIFG